MVLSCVSYSACSYSIEGGYTHDAEVIYGDTDSVMVKFGEQDMSKVMEMARDAAKFVTGHFVSPINLEFEKVCRVSPALGSLFYSNQ